MKKANPRKHGGPPYGVCVVHGGPGAAGDMASVAKALSSGAGVIEPIQTAGSVDGQIAELRAFLEVHGALPVTLIGHSWGAWLSWMTAAKYPGLAGKLILVGSGPFEEKYAREIHSVRAGRLSDADQREMHALLSALTAVDDSEADETFARLGEIISRADAFDPIDIQNDLICRYDIFRKVWVEASALRQSGKLLDMASRIQCPVVAIHGDYDPHPAEGVQEPLSGALKDFRFILLKRCGHKPWMEKAARDVFFQNLKYEVTDT